MRKFVRRTSSIAAVAAVAIGLTCIPAFAGHGDWEVDPEDTFTAGSVIAAFTIGSTSLQCTTSTVFGEAFDDLHGGLPPAVDHVADVGSSLWSGCGITVPPTQSFSVVVGHEGTWRFYADSVDPTDPDIVHGRLVDLEVDIQSPLCVATVSGQARATYTNSLGVLAVNEPQGGDLVVSDASCFGVLDDGDEPGFVGIYLLTPDNVPGPITISPAS